MKSQLDAEDFFLLLRKRKKKKHTRLSLIRINVIKKVACSRFYTVEDVDIIIQKRGRI